MVLSYIEDDEQEEQDEHESSDEDKYLSYRWYDYVKNKQIIRKFYNDIVQCIERSKYSFIDINLFKEDFIYYIYKLSDLDSLTRCLEELTITIQIVILKIWIIKKKNNKYGYLIVLNNLPFDDYLSCKETRDILTREWEHKFESTITRPT